MLYSYNNNNNNNNNELAVAFPRGGSSSTVSRSNWNLEVLVFVEGGKQEYPEKNPRSRVENQQQTQPTYDAGYRNRTRATLGGGECSHHCAIPAPQGCRSERNGVFFFVMRIPERCDALL